MPVPCKHNAQLLCGRLPATTNRPGLQAAMLFFDRATAAQAMSFNLEKTVDPDPNWPDPATSSSKRFPTTPHSCASAFVFI